MSEAKIQDVFEHWLEEFAPTVRDGLNRLYEAMTPEQQEIAGKLLKELSQQLNTVDLHQVLDLVKEQYAGVIEELVTICIVGPVNTGKSSLYNALIDNGQARAEVSPIPGTTKIPLKGESGVLLVVDTPGADDIEIGDEGGLAGRQRREAALQAARQADFLIIVFDASVGISEGALNVYKQLVALNKPYVIALNKMDLVRRHENQVVNLAARNLDVKAVSVIPISALKGSGLDRLIFALLKAEPSLLVSIAEVMPQYRFKLAQQRIMQAAVAAGTVNLTTSPLPVPFASFVPLVGLQVGLVLAIARIYGYQITPGRAKELLATFGAGFGARTLFQQLVTKVPGPGWLLGTAIASAMTLSIGYSSVAWFARGEKLTAETLRVLVEAITQDIVAALKAVDRKSLSREGLQAVLQDLSVRIAARFEKESAMQYLELQCLALGEWGTNCYVLTYGPTGETIIVDPAAEPDVILQAVAGLNVTGILLTHAHHDHTAALDEVREALDVSVGLHPADAEHFGIHADFDLLDGDKIPLGALALTVFYVPGHTPGSVILRLENQQAIVGDAIFPGGPGHTRTPQALAQSLDSLARTVFTWSDDIELLPGHGGSTTVGDERAAFEDFVAKPRPNDLSGDVTWR